MQRYTWVVTSVVAAWSDALKELEIEMQSMEDDGVEIFKVCGPAFDGSTRFAIIGRRRRDRPVGEE